MPRFTLTLLAAGLALGTIGAIAGSPAGDGHPHDGAHLAQHHGTDDGAVDRHDHLMDADPAMAEDMAELGVDPDRMRDAMAEGISPERLHRQLADEGVDVEQMLERCAERHEDSDGEHGGAGMPHDHAGGEGMPHEHSGGAGASHGPGTHGPAGGSHDRHHR